MTLSSFKEKELRKERGRESQEMGIEEGRERRKGGRKIHVEKESLKECHHLTTLQVFPLNALQKKM